MIKPPKGRQYKVKQSRYKALADVNPCRCIVLGSSGAGKDVWLTSFFTEIMKGAYERLYWFSPSCDVDHQMVHIKRFVEEELHTPITENGASRSGTLRRCGRSWTSRRTWLKLSRRRA